jgi:alkylation response protein AidB-like acyl-CoA dehydrogenase
MPVLLGRDPESRWMRELQSTLLDASGAIADVTASLEFAERLGRNVPLPAGGQTLRLWELLASLGAMDLTTARVVEPHLDAMAILHEAGEEQTPGTWGVFAAEGAGIRVVATESQGGWALTGVKPWCSLAGVLDHALITAHTAAGRRLFAIDLRDDAVTATQGGWAARGLRDVPSGPIDLIGVPARPVGAGGWYLDRAGFAWGGIGVAAIWFGASVALARTLVDSLREHEPDQLGFSILGSVDRDLHACREVFASAAREVDTGAAAPAILAQRVRSISAVVAERTLAAVAHALGPQPLVIDEEHARRVADLQLYVRQDHAERDLARLGEKLLERGERPW